VSTLGDAGGGGGVSNERGAIGGGALDHAIAGMTSAAGRGAAGTPTGLAFTGGEGGEATRGGVGASAFAGFAGPGLGSPGLPGSRIH
jgi:hypothetical protein